MRRFDSPTLIAVAVAIVFLGTLGGLELYVPGLSGKIPSLAIQGNDTYRVVTPGEPAAPRTEAAPRPEPSAAGGDDQPAGGEPVLPSPSTGVPVDSSEPRAILAPELVAYRDGYVPTGRVRVNVDHDAPALAAVPASEAVLERSLSQLSQGDCAEFEEWLPTSEENVVPHGSCAKYRYRISEEIAYTSSHIVRYDATPPAPPEVTLTEASPAEYVDETTLYYNPAAGGGSFKVTAAGSDPESGVTTVAFPALLGNEATTASESHSTEDYTWEAPSETPVVGEVEVTNSAGESSSASFEVVPDANAPAGGSVAYAEVGGVVTVDVELGSDELSGVARGSAKVERQTGTLHHGYCETLDENWTVVDVPDTPPAPRCIQYRVRVSDRVGNEAVYASPDVLRVLDETPPTVSIVTPDAGDVVSGLVRVKARAHDVGSGVSRVVFQLSEAGSGRWCSSIGWSWEAPYAIDWDTTGVEDGSYELRAVVTDGVGHRTISDVVAVTVTNEPPPPPPVEEEPPADDTEPDPQEEQPEPETEDPPETEPPAEEQPEAEASAPAAPADAAAETGESEGESTNDESSEPAEATEPPAEPQGDSEPAG